EHGGGRARGRQAETFGPIANDDVRDDNQGGQKQNHFARDDRETTERQIEQAVGERVDGRIAVEPEVGEQGKDASYEERNAQEIDVSEITHSGDSWSVKFTASEAI